MNATTLETDTLRISKTIARADVGDPSGVGLAVVALVKAFDAAENSHKVRDFILQRLGAQQ